jgi:hypothetical protein
LLDARGRNYKTAWTKNCENIVQSIALHALAMTVQPRPILGRVDLAAIFMDREKFFEENVFYSNFSDTRVYTCLSCQDGYLTEYLVKNRHWTYRRLPIDGLKSTLFHGPSPSWCIASGNVWFDHPDVDKVSCYTQRSVDLFRLTETKLHPIYDWTHFEEKKRLCLRLNAHGFAQVETKFTKAERQQNRLTAPATVPAVDNSTAPAGNKTSSVNGAINTVANETIPSMNNSTLAAW